MSASFNYEEAFSRNIGWVTETEQALLRTKRVAIAGMGGVGGDYLITLTRLGIGRFNISDMDIFELANFNRQAGASLPSVNRPKMEVQEQLAKEINPELDIRGFPNGVSRENMDQFLEGVDLYVDGLDFFAVDARRAVFDACEKRGIPAITAAPLGMGVAFLAFLPGKMSFEEYFRLEGETLDEQLLRFLLGLSPAMLQMSYLVDDSRVDLAAHRGPSTPMACKLCAGVAATNALKILLNRGGVVAAPWGIHYDAYRNRYKKTWRPGGNDNWLQQLGLKIARKRLSGKLTAAKNTEEENGPQNAVERILDLARWAPSGDNTQPWQFEVIDSRNLVIHASDTRDWVVYDLDGRASQTAVGALMETLSIAATGEGYRADFKLRPDAPDESPVIDVKLVKSKKVEESPLLPYIKARVTNRRPFSTSPLSVEQKSALEAAVGEGYRVLWLESSQQRWEMAKLLFNNANIRLTIPEAYEVHKQIIEWDAQFSVDRIPDQAVGLDPVGLKLMRWAMVSWDRVKFLNKYFAGTWIPRIQLDLIPGYQCAAHFMIVSDKPLVGVGDYFAGGRALQRFWLTATQQGLQFQPEMTPVIFSRYCEDSISFSSTEGAERRACSLMLALKKLYGINDIQHLVFHGRVGVGAIPNARSIRKHFPI